MTADEILVLAADTAARLTGIGASTAYLGLKLAKLVAEQTTDPEVYLQELLDDVQRRAQQAARDKFG